MPKYKVVCIDKDGTYHEAVYENLDDAVLLFELLKSMFNFKKDDVYGLMLYEDEKVIMHEDF